MSTSPRSQLFPYTTLFRSAERMPPPWRAPRPLLTTASDGGAATPPLADFVLVLTDRPPRGVQTLRSEEHTSELQSRPHIVCRLLLEKKKRRNRRRNTNQCP